MINLAVIELKDIIKYLIKITLIIAIAIGLTKFFTSFKTKLNIDKSSFLSCLDTVIPSIKNVNKKDEIEQNKKDFNPIKMTLGIELGMADSISNGRRKHRKCKH